MSEIVPDLAADLYDPLPADAWVELERAATEDVPTGGGLITLAVDVRLTYTNRVVTLDACEHVLLRGATVVAETERGLSIGVVVREAHRTRVPTPLMRVVRAATAEDHRQEEHNRLREEEALRFCWERVRARALPMKLVKVEYLLGGNKAVFYFASEGRIDFRELVKDLAYRLHTRVEMRQIGVRDASMMIGGLGPCGRELCCSSWLQRFEPVSIRMAKTQNLSLNPQKVSGVCGRLMCCLAYEQETYQALRKRLPRAGRNAMTPRGPGRVGEIDILRQRVRVFFADGSLVEFESAQVRELAGDGHDDEPERGAEEHGAPHDGPSESRPRLPAAGREIVSAPRPGGGRRKPWQVDRPPRAPNGETAPVPPAASPPAIVQAAGEVEGSEPPTRK